VAALPFETAASPPPQGEGGTGSRHIASRRMPPGQFMRRGEARARPGPGALPRNSYSPCQTAQSSSFPRRVAAPGFCISVFHPPHEGRAERRRAQYFCCRAVGRDGPRLRGAARVQRDALASRRSTVAILGRGPRFHLRHFFRIRAASSSQPGRSAWRAGSRTSRGLGYEPRPQDATPRSAFRIVSRRRPSMSRDMRHVAPARMVVKVVSIT
jgi:hypothetical protein